MDRETWGGGGREKVSSCSPFRTLKNDYLSGCTCVILEFRPHQWDWLVDRQRGWSLGFQCGIKAELSQQVYRGSRSWGRINGPESWKKNVTVTWESVVMGTGVKPTQTLSCPWHTNILLNTNFSCECQEGQLHLSRQGHHPRDQKKRPCAWGHCSFSSTTRSASCF